MRGIDRLLLVLKALKDVWDLLPTSWKATFGGVVFGAGGMVIGALSHVPAPALYVWSLLSVATGVLLALIVTWAVDEVTERRQARERQNRVWLDDKAFDEMLRVASNPERKPSFVAVRELDRFKQKWLRAAIKIEDIYMHDVGGVAVHGRRPHLLFPSFSLSFPPKDRTFFEARALGTVISVAGRVAFVTDASVVLDDCEIEASPTEASSSGVSSSQPFA